MQPVKWVWDLLVATAVDLTIDVGKLSVKGQIVNFMFCGPSKVSVVSSFYFVDGARDCIQGVMYAKCRL